MTIDEAIAQEREIAKEQKTKYDNCLTRMRYCCEMCFHNPKCNEVAEYNEQLAEWLEELKDYRDNSKMVVRVDVENMDSIKDEIDKLSKYAEIQYNKALDDFVKFANTMPTVEEEDGEIRPMWLEEIAENLKVGGENDNLRR